MITGTFERCRSVRHTSVPDSPGSMRSSSTRSAPDRSNSLSASGPVPATATSKPSRRSMYDSASENDSSSSTTSTRVTGFLSCRAHRPVRSRRAPTPPRLIIRLPVDIRTGNGQPQGERGARALDAPHAHPAAVVGGDVLDDGQAEAGAAGGPGPRRVGPVEPLEDPLQVPLGDADALVADGDLDVPVPAPGADRHPRPLRAVRDGVVDEVDQRGDQLGLVAADREPALAAGDHDDPGRLGRQPGAVDGLGHDLVHGHDRRRRQRLGALQPGQLDQLGHQPAEPGALVLHPAGEPADRLRVVGRVLHRLGQQGQRADRRLELVRDVGDEVPADRLQPAVLGEVVEQQRHVAALHQRGDPGADRDRLPAEPAAGVDDRVPGLAVAAGGPGQPAQVVDDDPATADHAHPAGGRVGQHHLVGRVEHDGRAAHHLQHAAGQRGWDRLDRRCRCGRRHRRRDRDPPADQQERDENAGNRPDHQGGGDRHDLHVTDRTVAWVRGRPVARIVAAGRARISPSVRARFTGTATG